jgi:hypothetical protein
VLGEQGTHRLFHLNNNNNFIGRTRIRSGIGSRRVLLLSLATFLLLGPLLLLLLRTPLVLSVAEGAQFDALGDLHLVDAFQAEVGVDGIEEVELVLGDERVLWVGNAVRE